MGRRKSERGRLAPADHPSASHCSHAPLCAAVWVTAASWIGRNTRPAHRGCHQKSASRAGDRRARRASAQQRVEDLRKLRAGEQRVCIERLAVEAHDPAVSCREADLRGFPPGLERRPDGSRRLVRGEPVQRAGQLGPVTVCSGGTGRPAANSSPPSGTPAPRRAPSAPAASACPRPPARARALPDGTGSPQAARA